MSGHSKFANIKHKKEKNDAAKGKIFTIIGREIAVAVKEGGPDPANNFKLAQVIAKAKASNMPNDTIERGIKKASGDGNAVNYEHLFAIYDCDTPSLAASSACVILHSASVPDIARADSNIFIPYQPFFALFYHAHPREKGRAVAFAIS